MEVPYSSNHFITNIMRKLRHTQLVLGGGRILAQAIYLQSVLNYYALELRVNKSMVHPYYGISYSN